MMVLMRALASGIWKGAAFRPYVSGFHLLRKNTCFVSGHDFSRAVNDGSDEGFSPWDFEGCSLQAVRKRFSPIAEKHCFVSGHDFSRAVNDGSDEGFSPWVIEGYGLQAVRKRLSPVAEKHMLCVRARL